MIAAVLLIAAAAFQEPDSEVLTRDTFVSASPSYPYEVREPVGNYLTCLEGGDRSFGLDESMEEVRIEDALRCEDVKEAEIVRATAIFSAKMAEEKAREEMRALFASLKEHHLARGRIEDAQRSELLREMEENEI